MQTDDLSTANGGSEDRRSGAQPTTATGAPWTSPLLPVALAAVGFTISTAVVWTHAGSRAGAWGPASIGIVAILLIVFSVTAWIVSGVQRRCRDAQEYAAAHTRIAGDLRARLDGILGGAEAGFWDWRIPTDDRWYSPRVYELLGFDKDAIRRGDARLRIAVHDDDRDSFDGEMQARRQTGKMSAIEYRLQASDGTHRWFRDRGCVVEWTQTGEPARITGALTEISDEVRRRCEFETNRELLQRAEAIARIGGWKWDLNTNELSWTEQVFRIHELPMTYRPDVDAALDFYEPASRTQLEAALFATRRDGTPFDLELKFVTSKGTRLWVRAMGEPDFIGEEIVGVHGTFQDISERKRFELALQESEQRYKLAVESAADGIWDWNIPGDELVQNESWGLMIGHEPKQTMTRFDQWLALVHPDDISRVRSVLQAYLDNKTPRFESRQRMKTKAGDWKWVLTRGKVVARDAMGRPRRMTGTHKDVSFDKEVEEQLRAAHRDAEAATRAKTEFLANMSHEIRTPMTAILGFSDSLLFDDIDESERVQALHTIRRNGEHLLEIINDILDLSKIEAGRLKMERIYCSPLKVAHETTELLRVRAESKQLGLALELEGDVPSHIETDPLRLKQILVNVIGNAIKFTETGGVRIVLRFVPDESNSMLQFDVFDTGIGMSKAEMSRLFHAFMQADSTMTRRFGGTGLGLVISRRLAEMLGGTISVESAPGKGSRFTISVATGDVRRIPFVDSLQSVVGEADDEVPANDVVDERIGGRVLVVEDGPDNQRLIMTILRKMGMTPVLAENGGEAIRIISDANESKDAFDVVLMDMQMPVVDGYDATRQLRADGFDRPIIALTAHAMRGDRDKCIAAGCTDYLTKPIHRRELFECLHRHLSPIGA